MAEPQAFALSSLWVIVPVKPLGEGKSRLAGVLQPDQRQRLNLQMFEHTLETLCTLAEISQILVISRDPHVLARAKEHTCHPLQETTPGLNHSLYQASNYARAHGAVGVLVLPTDLPLVRAEDLRAFIRLCQPPGIVIAPDRHRQGTNALLISPPGSMRFLFGERSFLMHLAEAQACQLHTATCERHAFGLDIDLPEDLAALDQPLT